MAVVPEYVLAITMHALNALAVAARVTGCISSSSCYQSGKCGGCGCSGSCFGSYGRCWQETLSWQLWLLTLVAVKAAQVVAASPELATVMAVAVSRHCSSGLDNSLLTTC